MTQKNKFVFAIHRGGSSVLGDVVKNCALASDEEPVMIGASTKAFKETGPEGTANRVSRAASVVKGGKHVQEFSPNLANWQARSGVFSPIRRPDFFPAERFEPGDIALLNMRDPRDCMVSGYFGFLRLHGEGLKDETRKRMYDEGIDAYVLDKLLDDYTRVCRGYMELNDALDGQLKILTYEEMTTDFPSWFKKFYDLLEFEFDTSRFKELGNRMAKKFEPPEKEDIDSHKRQMFPGDHLRKLKPETIDEVNRRMAGELRYFGYL